MATKPTVCLVESLGFLEEQTHKEGEIIARTLQMSGKRSAYAYVRSKKELSAVVREFEVEAPLFPFVMSRRNGWQDGSRFSSHDRTTQFR